MVQKIRESMTEELNINKISAEVISDLAKNAASFVVNKIGKIYKLLSMILRMF